jgi:putative SOS response-associated peptidase YedK
MCSRYNLTSPPEAARAHFAYSDRPNFPVQYNIAPTQPIAVVCLDETGTRRFRLMRWGLLPAFVKNPKTFPTLINARSEEVLTKPSFRHAVRRRRYLVPANGFYEWTGPKGQRRPFHVGPRAPRLIAFAGLYECWQDPEGGETDTVTILTCAANRIVSAPHDRMPAIVEPGRYDDWLDTTRVSAEEALAMIGPAADDLFETVEMHPKINDPRKDEPGIQEPLQLSLL